MPLILSLTFGAGVLLIFLSATTRWAPPREQRPDRLATALREFLDRNGARELSPRDFLVLSTICGIALAAVTQLGLGWPAVSAATFAIGLLLPAWYFRNRHERQRGAVQAALADAVDSLRAAVRTGMSVEESIASLARNGPEVLRRPFGELARELRLGGFEEGLRRTRDQVAEPVFDTVAAALVMSHRVGGRNLGAVLDSLSRSVRQSVQVERELRAHQAKNVISARIIAALPLILILAVRSLNPTYLEVFSSPAGQGILALCLLSVAVGYAGMLRATHLPIETRVLE